MKKQLNSAFSAFLILLAVACQPQTEAVPINFGKDQCTFCKMTISNPKFGAELITDKGRVLKYDAAECMVHQLREEHIEYQKLYVVPFDQPKQLKPAGDLRFLITPDIRSPMGANLSAYLDTAQLDEQYHPQLMSWEQLTEELQ